MQHQIPISATFTLFKYFNLTPTFNYTERWYTNKTAMGGNGYYLWFQSCI